MVDIKVEIRVVGRHWNIGVGLDLSLCAASVPFIRKKHTWP